jgi:alanine-glyoxylate transaminase/serine-glyoxylate transaminase/serine-pyruvate transaminase
MINPMDELRPPIRLMLTPGPSCISPRVYRAMATSLVGHVDPWFTEFMGGVQELMRRVFQTQNHITFPISASGTGGIETAVINVLEPGDEAIVCVNGVFSARMGEIADRTGAKIHRVSAPFGRTVDPDDVRRAGQGRKIKFVGVAHGETSTGVVTKLEPFRKVADELGALLVVDSVATLAGVPLDVDRQRIDVCFSGTQ